MSTSEKRPPIETRSVDAPLELRSAPGGEVVVIGCACRYDTSYALGRFNEVVVPGAFRSDFKSGRNVRLLHAHKDDQLLASLKANTLTLETRSDGVHFSASLPDTQLGRDVATMVRRGDLAGASVGFAVKDSDWAQSGDGRPLRRIKSCELFEISICANPANEATSVSVELRAQAEAFESRAGLRAELAALELGSGGSAMDPPDTARYRRELEALTSPR